jgi:hypothetical protein
MTPYMILNRIREYIEEKLEEHNYRLRATPPNEAQDQEGAAPQPDADRYTVPGVYVGGLPHSNFMADLPGQFFRAPYVLVGMEEAEEDYDGGVVGILVQVCAYSEIDYDNSSVPDYQAFLDALNLLQFLKDKLIMQWTLEGTAWKKPIRMGMYTSQAMTWPFAFGYLAFGAELVSEAPSNILFKE